MEKQHFEVLLENMDSKINLILEGYSVLDKRIVDEGKKRREEYDLLNVKISALSQCFDGVDSRLDGIDGRLEGIHGELIAHRNNTEMHKAPRKREIKKVA
ncbi:MAG: hypothetical protein Q7W05_14445 [Deltaproteobacteria bacterium]|nr:hypothetical protein [Deltaproteobacteria bacterium]